MKGIDLFEKILSEGGEYAQTVQTAFSVIGNDLFTMLEKADREGKKIEISESENDTTDPEIKVFLK